ncbi:unnamed protein product [Candidula unifasciata]|uniref:ADP/ATP translocase n=1 Tax=Candidula unifasciata TaxID=100452 RepID=A0A8S3YYB8_9EUPU|nr:unnamed protein product [Candidula unifasciata]
MTDTKPLNFAENFLLSGSAAVISKTTVAPIERIKLLIQNQNEMIKLGRLPSPYKGIVNCAWRTIQTEGVVSLWRSNFVNCVRYFPTQALNFAFNDHIKTIFKKSPGESHPRRFIKNILSGSAAGALSNCITYSLDYARTRLALDTKLLVQAGADRQFSGLIDVYKKTWRSDGIQGLYKGFFVSLVSIMIYRGLYFGFYDSLKPMVLEKDPGFLASFTLSYSITVTANLIVYPLDTIRRRLMVTCGEKIQYKGALDCAFQIIKKEGSLTLMKGATANILRNIAGAGVLAGFDQFRDLYISLHTKRSMTHRSKVTQV